MFLLNPVARVLDKVHFEVAAAFRHVGRELFVEPPGLAKVAEGRNMDKEAVHEIAQGRVWSGAEAKELGLVDTLGGLEVAVRSAADRAGLENYRMRYYQKKKELQDVIMEMLQDNQQTSVSSGPVFQALHSISRLLRDIRNYDDPNGVYARMPFDLTIR